MKNACIYRSLVIASDLSPTMSQVVQCVSRFIRLFCESATMVHVLPGEDSDSNPTEIPDELLKVLNEHMNEIRNYIPQTELKILFGKPSTEIANFIKRSGAEFLVIGSHGHSRIRETFLGSVASELLDKVTVPTLVVKHHASDGDICPLDFTGRFLFLTDFSENADSAFKTLLSLAPIFEVGVTLLHVHDLSRLLPDFDPKIEELNRIDNERLSVLRQRLIENGVNDVDTKIVAGPPKKSIMEEINRTQYGLVVLGSRGRDWMEEWMLGSIAHTVTRMSKTSLLLVPLSQTNERVEI